MNRKQKGLQKVCFNSSLKENYLVDLTSGENKTKIVDL